MPAGFGGTQCHHTYVLQLPSNPDELRFGGSRNNAGILRNVRKAARLGVVVRDASTVDDVRRWYRLYAETMRVHAVPPRPLRLFEALWELLAPRNHLRLLLAEKHAGICRRLLAGSIFLFGGNIAGYAFNGRDGTQLEYRPNDAIHWSAITQASGQGFRRYHFGEVPADDAGLARFKAKWGALPSPLFHYYYPRQREIGRGFARSGPPRRATEWAWRRLPLPVATGLGGWVYRRL